MKSFKTFIVNSLTEESQEESMERLAQANKIRAEALASSIEFEKRLAQEKEKTRAEFRQSPQVQQQGKNLSDLWQKYLNAKGTPGERAAFDAWSKADDEFTAASEKRIQEYRTWRDQRAAQGAEWAVRSQGREERENIRKAGQDIATAGANWRAAKTPEEEETAFKIYMGTLDAFDAGSKEQKRKLDQRLRKQAQTPQETSKPTDEVPYYLQQPQETSKPTDEVPPLLSSPDNKPPSQNLASKYPARSQYYRDNPEKWNERLNLVQQFGDATTAEERNALLAQVKKLDSKSEPFEPRRTA